jgi:hypothetical protein
MSETSDFEYFDGVKTIQHQDGSTTYIHTTHEPYVEPLTGKESAIVIGIATLLVAGACALPFAIERGVEWTEHRAKVRRIKREKKIDDLKSKTD